MSSKSLTKKCCNLGASELRSQGEKEQKRVRLRSESKYSWSTKKVLAHKILLNIFFTRIDNAWANVSYTPFLVPQP